MSVSFSSVVQRARQHANPSIGKAMREAISRVPPTLQAQLPNGLRVACEETSNTDFATVGVCLDAGSKYDTKHFAGVAKLMEICAFQGTTNQSRDQLCKALEEVGGHIYVNTDREITQLMIKTSKNNVEKAVKLLGEILRNTRLADQDISEGKRILAQLKADHDENPDQITYDNLLTCAYDSADNSIGQNPLPYASQLARLNREELIKYRDTHWAPNRMVVVGSGAVSLTDLEKFSKATFGDMSSVVKPKAPQRFIGGDYRLVNLQMALSHNMWAIETCGAKCEDVVPLTLGTHIWGDFHRSQHELVQHTSQRMYNVFSALDHGGGSPKMRHFPKQGVEHMNTFSKFYEDTGLVGCYHVGRVCSVGMGGTDNVPTTITYSFSEFQRIAQKNIHPAELDQAKVNYKAQLLFNNDGTTNSAMDIGTQTLQIGRRVPVTEMYARIDDCTATNVQETYEHYFYSRPPVFSHYGNFGIMPNYDWERDWTYKYFY